jgi:tyrosinase-like protein
MNDELERIGNAERPPLQNFNPQMPLPQQFRRPDLCTIPTLDRLGNGINQWHGDVHGAVGGTMFEFAVASAAPIFWCWHASVDDVAFDWETCP